MQYIFGILEACWLTQGRFFFLGFDFVLNFIVPHYALYAGNWKFEFLFWLIFEKYYIAIDWSHQDLALQR